MYFWVNYSFTFSSLSHSQSHFLHKTCAVMTLGCDDLTSFISLDFVRAYLISPIYARISVAFLDRCPAALNILFGRISTAQSLSFSLSLSLLSASKSALFIPTVVLLNHTDLIRRRVNAHIAMGHFHYLF